MVLIEHRHYVRMGETMNWQHQRSLTPDDFATALDQLGLSQAAAARYFGLSSRQISRMVHGQSEVPTPLTLLIFSLIHHNETPIVPPRIPGTF